MSNWHWGIGYKTMFNQRQTGNTAVSKLVSANLFIDPLSFLLLQYFTAQKYK